jgi:hypothetical protein
LSVRTPRADSWLTFARTGFAMLDTSMTTGGSVAWINSASPGLSWRMAAAGANSTSVGEAHISLVGDRVLMGRPLVVVESLGRDLGVDEVRRIQAAYELDCDG